MGLWAQNVGVKAPSLPPTVLARARSELMGVPEPMEGWTWATLDDFVELDELEALLVEATGHAGAPGLAFSVHDSDSVYLVGADTSGVRFRLAVNQETWEGAPLPFPQGIEAAVAWSEEHGSLGPSREEIADVLGRQYVFAEEGLAVLLARMGLVPAEIAERAEEFDEEGLPDAQEVWSWLETVPTPELRILEHGRWWTTLEYGEVSGHLLAAEEDSTALAIDLTGPAIGVGSRPWEGVSGYAIRAGEPIGFIGQMTTREELWSELTRQGVKLGTWEVVAESVPRDLGSTAAWVQAQGH